MNMSLSCVIQVRRGRRTCTTCLSTSSTAARCAATWRRTPADSSAIWRIVTRPVTTGPAPRSALLSRSSSAAASVASNPPTSYAISSYTPRLYLCNFVTERLLTHTHTHPFNRPLSRTTRVSRYQRGKTNLDFTEARDSKWQWHQLGHMQVCTSLQTDNHASTPPLSFFTGWMPFLPPNQQCQSTEGKQITNIVSLKQFQEKCRVLTLWRCDV